MYKKKNIKKLKTHILYWESEWKRKESTHPPKIPFHLNFFLFFFYQVKLKEKEKCREQIESDAYTVVKTH